MTQTATDSLAGRLRAALDRAIDPRGLVVLRVGFGALILFSTLRVVAYGWVEELYVNPTYHFTWQHLDFVQPWPAWAMYLHFGLIGLAGLGIMLGAFYRASAVALLVLWTWVELIDKALYLNHYYFVSLVAALLAVLPLHRACSVDARRGLADANKPMGAWVSWALRAQVGLVYFYAGVAKLNADWLLRAQPLRIWLAAHTDLPLVGQWMAEPWLAYAMSWSGALYDLTIPFWLLWRPSRPWAWASVVGFHVITWALFPIGVFPWVMILMATVFFAHDWPGRFGFKARPAARSTGGGVPAWLGWALAAFLGLQALLPLRFLLYPGHINWHEQGFRFAWRVMLIEKAGYLEYEVRDPSTGRTWTVYPREGLTPQQRKSIATQPDMILQYAHELRDRYRAQGVGPVQIYAESWVSWNGRSSARLVDPEVDLAAQPRGLGDKPWILPAPP
jgi:hypothetical protein